MPYIWVVTTYIADGGSSWGIVNGLFPVVEGPLFILNWRLVSDVCAAPYSVCLPVSKIGGSVGSLKRRGGEARDAEGCHGCIVGVMPDRDQTQMMLARLEMSGIVIRIV